MHVTKKALSRAQKILRTIIPFRVYRPVLGSVLIRDCCAIGTDLEHTVRVALAPGAQSEPAFLVPWAQFKTIRGDTDITPVLEDADRPKVRISGALLESFPVDDFPAVPAAAPDPRQEIDIDRLLLHLQRCDVVRAHDDNARALLTAIAVEEDGALLATDGFCAYVSDPDPSGEVLARMAGGRGILPGAAARVLGAFGWDHAMAGAETQTWTSTSYAGGEKNEVEHTGVRWFFASDGEAAWLRGLEGKYFPVRDLVPKTFPHSATFDREQLLTACAQAVRVAFAAPHPLTLQVGGNRVRLSSKSEGNELDLDLPASTTGEPVNMAFNSMQLHAALRRIADGQHQVTLECSGPTSLARIQVEGGAHLQMPLQLPEDFDVQSRWTTEPEPDVEAQTETRPTSPLEDAAEPEPEQTEVTRSEHESGTAATPTDHELEPTRPSAVMDRQAAVEPNDHTPDVADDSVATLIDTAQEAVAHAQALLARLLLAS